MDTVEHKSFANSSLRAAPAGPDTHGGVSSAVGWAGSGPGPRRTTAPDDEAR